MGYISQIDRRATIRVAKKELNDFAVLMTLSKTFGQLSSIDFARDGQDISYVNYDNVLLRNIEVKDQQEKELENVLEALNILNYLDLEILWLKHINKKSNDDICSTMGLVTSGMYRKLNDAYVAFAVAYGTAILKG